MKDNEKPFFWYFSIFLFSKCENISGVGGLKCYSRTNRCLLYVMINSGNNLKSGSMTGVWLESAHSLGQALSKGPDFSIPSSYAYPFLLRCSRTMESICLVFRPKEKCILNRVTNKAHDREDQAADNNRIHPRVGWKEARDHCWHIEFVSGNRYQRVRMLIFCQSIAYKYSYWYFLSPSRDVIEILFFFFFTFFFYFNIIL